MTTNLNPYINFKGQAREAMDFYQSVFGGELARSTFNEFGMAHDPAEGDLIMHSQLTTEGGLVLMAADSPADMPFTPGNNISVSLSGTDEAELHGYWNKLADGATIAQPLEKAPWGDSFGMLVDKFGINWLVNIGGTPQEPTPQP
ncbi:VOC family protein [Herbiconiux daphne]|uniref:VOC family protein n=1 Tax=Herbiconiux daphne TaxID=2970914 RepID=A0ABT2H4E0_9MICO|nr:VOC family protein [Herbiconiux daphne]MCS5734787.1 VOC family protein [Herbiconiux daphne]